MNSKSKFLSIAAREASKHQYLDLNFFDRIITQESKWQPEIVNPVTGASGLGQLLPPSIEDYNNEFGTSVTLTEVRYNPYLNLKISAWYLGTKIPEYLRYYGKPVDEYHQAWAYNAGIGKVVDGIMPDETVDYIRKTNAKKKRVPSPIDFIWRIFVAPVRRLKNKFTVNS